MAKNQETDPTVIVQILTNGILIDDHHHAKGKQMALPQSKANALENLTPPAVRIVGV